MEEEEEERIDTTPTEVSGWAGGRLCRMGGCLCLGTPRRRGSGPTSAFLAPTTPRPNTTKHKHDEQVPQGESDYEEGGTDKDLPDPNAEVRDAGETCVVCWKGVGWIGWGVVFTWMDGVV